MAERNLTLLTDLYELTMMQGYFKSNSTETVIFDEKGLKVDAESSEIQLGDVKPFSVMTNAEVNNIDNMDGYGLPKIYNNIPFFNFYSHASCEA